MIHYNNDNNAYCSTVNAKKFETGEHGTVHIRTFLYTRNLYSYSHLDIFICIYSVRGEIDQTSTNTLRCTTCYAANVYILIAAPIVPLRKNNFVIYNHQTDCPCIWALCIRSCIL